MLAMIAVVVLSENYLKEKKEPAPTFEFSKDIEFGQKQTKKGVKKTLKNILRDNNAKVSLIK